MNLDVRGSIALLASLLLILRSSEETSRQAFEPSTLDSIISMLLHPHGRISNLLPSSADRDPATAVSIAHVDDLAPAPCRLALGCILLTFHAMLTGLFTADLKQMHLAFLTSCRIFQSHLQISPWPTNISQSGYISGGGAVETQPF